MKQAYYLLLMITLSTSLMVKSLIARSLIKTILNINNGKYSNSCSDTLLYFATNKKANNEYEFEEKFEAGIQLLGTEVRSCRKSSVQLSDGYGLIIDGECWLYNVHISEYHRAGDKFQHQTKRNRKLLLHKKEILKLEQLMLQRNLEIIPLRMYFNEKQLIKVEIGLAKKKSVQDKRQDIIKKEGDRDIRRVMKNIRYD